VEQRLAGVPGVAVHVGGAAAASDLASWLDGRLPWVMAFVLVLTFLVMLVSFGSPSLALATVGLNLLSVGAAYGVLTLVFQHSWAEGLLGFTSIGSIAAWLPLLMFVLLFGLSMDYHVFVVSRVREAYKAGAVAQRRRPLGVARSAGVVTSAAAVMVAVFSVFGTLSTLEMKQLGVGLATAVLLDATLVRGVLLPAVLALLGRRAHTGPRWVPVLHH
jgi:RND superfamily putative drug exporter